MSILLFRKSVDYFFGAPCVLFFLLTPGILCEDCSLCQSIASDFITGLNSKVKKGFVGGNTEWEERNIGRYATSEILFNEIVETLCSLKDNTCHELLEQLEPSMELWWKTVYKAGGNNVLGFGDFLCIEQTSLCCPSNHYGPYCSPCSSCSTLGGACDGNGTRTGSGVCRCQPGYTGTTCADCDLMTHFKFDTGVGPALCQQCHFSCSGGCSGPASADCVGCAPGWTQVMTDNNSTTCFDVDECATGPCSYNEYCENLDGSYACHQCSPECRSCTGSSAKQCVECNSGYHRSGQECIDIDECESNPSLCRRDGEVCRNTRGGFICACAPGFESRNGLCSPVSDGKFKRGRRPTPRNNFRVIWTVEFTKQFAKYIGTLCAFIAFCWFVRGHIFLTFAASCALGTYVYYQSILFDNIFSKKL